MTLQGECVNWTGVMDPTGYGRVWRNGKKLRAHRAAYEDALGPVPAGLVLDHLCRNRACVNPAHLEAVTQKENLRRSALALASLNRVKTHCPKGHPYDDQNTLYRKNGYRECRACGREESRAHQRTHREIRNARKRAKRAAMRSIT